MKKEQFKRIFSIALSVMLVIAGICLMVQCVSIYRSGDRPFSREAVAAHFSPIAAVIFSTLAMVFLSFVLEILIPAENKKLLPGKQYRLILQRLQEKRDLSSCDEALLSNIAAQQNRRRKMVTIRTGLIVLCAVIFLSYGCNGANFDQMDINSSMVRAMYVLLPCCAVPFGWALYTAHQERISLQAEIDLWKQAPVSKNPVSAPVCEAKQLPIRNILLIAGICLLIYGYFTGGTNDVLTKAINICTECVGLG